MRVDEHEPPPVGEVQGGSAGGLSEREARDTSSERQAAASVPERADPDEMSQLLMESEHRGRYLWAAALAAGRTVIDAGCGTGYGSEILAGAGAKSVVGVDISQEAIDYASATYSGPRRKFRLGSLHDLPFEEASFDLAVCFEVIEHVEDQRRAIAELRRVLNPTGVLAISSPNRDVYPPGNPHHVHEFAPAELEGVLAEKFANVYLYRQSAWLASAILDDEQSRGIGAEHALHPQVVKIASVRPGEEMYTVALASDGELPVGEAIALLGKPLEFRWWQEQLTAAREHESEMREREQDLREQFLGAAREAATLRQRVAVANGNELGSARRVLEVEALLADAQARVAALAEAYDAHELQLAQLGERLDRADRVMSAIKSSLSWRLTAPLRALKRGR